MSLHTEVICRFLFWDTDMKYIRFLEVATAAVYTHTLWMKKKRYDTATFDGKISFY
jgi:hypothetical protein